MNSVQCMPADDNSDNKDLDKLGGRDEHVWKRDWEDRLRVEIQAENILTIYKEQDLRLKDSFIFTMRPSYAQCIPHLLLNTMPLMSCTQRDPHLILHIMRPSSPFEHNVPPLSLYSWSTQSILHPLSNNAPMMYKTYPSSWCTYIMHPLDSCI